jgi:hypothetical protein
MNAAALCVAACLAAATAADTATVDVQRELAKARAFEKTVLRGAAPQELLEHLRVRGLILSPRSIHHGARVAWVVERPTVAPDCSLSTEFLVFPRDADRAQTSAYLGRFNAGTVLNARAMIAMFYPSGQGEGCASHLEAYEAAATRLVAAFESYEPPP